MNGKLTTEKFIALGELTDELCGIRTNLDLASFLYSKLYDVYFLPGAPDTDEKKNEQLIRFETAYNYMYMLGDYLHLVTEAISELDDIAWTEDAPDSIAESQLDVRHRIRCWRENAGMSIEQLSEKSCVDTETLYKLEKGTLRTVGTCALAAIAKALGMTVEEMCLSKELPGSTAA